MKGKNKFIILSLLLITSISGYFAFAAPQENGKKELYVIKQEKITNVKSNTNTQPSTTPSYRLPVTNHQSIITSHKLQNKSKTASLVIGNQTIETEITAGTTVYDFMNLLIKQEKLEFSGKDFGSGMGFFVEEINGKKNDKRSQKYWIYYINNKKAKAGISYQKIQPNDIITWIYETEKL